MFALAVWLRVYRLSDPIAGFHAFNEGFYVNISLADMHRGLFAWFTHPLDLNNPPLYSLVVTTLFRLFGQSVELARLVSVVSGIVTVWLVFELGRTLFDKRTGVVGAMILALMPGAVLVGRNAQVDPLLVALMFGSVVCWVHASAREEGGDWWALAGGLLLGFALVTKLPAVLVVPGLIVYQTVRSRAWKWVRERRTWAFIGASATVPLVWYAARFALDRGAFVSTQANLADVASSLPNLDTAWHVMFVEPFWMIGAATAVLMIAGIVAMARSRTAGDVLVGIESLTCIVFLVVYHYHIYYWLPATPFFALVAARGLASVTKSSRAWFASVTVATALVLALSSAVMLSGQKWGAWSAAQLQPLVASPADGVVIAVDDDLWNNDMAPVMQYYLPARAILREDQPAPPGTLRVLDLQVLPPEGLSPQMVENDRVAATLVRPVVFGWAVMQEPSHLNYFGNGEWTFERVEPWWYFGIDTEVAGGDYGLYDITAQVLGSQQP